MTADRLAWLVLLAAAPAVLACGAKTVGNYGGGGGAPSDDAGVDAGVDAGGPLSVSCGDAERYTSPGRPIALEAEVRAEARVESRTWRVASSPRGSAPSLEPTTGPVTSFTPDEVGDFVIEHEARDARGRAATCSVTVHSVVGPPVAVCPEGPLRTTVGVPLLVEGDAFDDGRVVSVAWEVVAQPAGSRARVRPEDALTTELTANAPGPHVLELRVIDDDGERDSCTVRVIVSGPPELSCPGAITAPTRRPAVIEARASDDGRIVDVLWQVVERPPGSLAEPRPPDELTTRLVPDRAGVYVLRVTVTDDDGLTASCEVRLVATPTGPDAVCPDTIVTTPLRTIDVEGRGVDDGEVVSYRWELTAQPAGSAAGPPRPANAAVTRFTPDVAGEYRLRLTVVDDMGERDACDVLVRAVAEEGLRVEIFWNGPPDRSCDGPSPPSPCDGSDVDLHLLRPGDEVWFDVDGDCHWSNCDVGSLDWGARGDDTDDPRLDIDDTEGFGPENINVDDPEPGLYRVGVDLWDGDGSPTAEVTVNIFCGETATEPVATFGPVRLRENRAFTREDNDFWRVADVDVRDVGCRVIDLTSPDGSPDIITHGAAERSR